MQPLRHPEVLSFKLPTEFVHYLLEQHAHPTTLIVCSTREAFLQELLASIQTTGNPSTPKSVTESLDEESQEAPLHPLLLHTVNLIAASKTINLAFCQTLQHLRAF